MPKSNATTPQYGNSQFTTPIPKTLGDNTEDLPGKNLKWIQKSRDAFEVVLTDEDSKGSGGSSNVTAVCQKSDGTYHTSFPKTYADSFEFRQSCKKLSWSFQSQDRFRVEVVEGE